MSSKIYVVGNKVNIPDSSFVSKHSNNDTIVFVGKMSYAPNVLAVTHFADNIFPSLCINRPNLKFIIVGAYPGNNVKKLAKRPNIVVTGYVDSVEPYYRHATIVVAPMLTGAGIQNKILQAMSYGCCVVTTPIGAEGITVNHDEIGVFANDISMTQGISALLNNPVKRMEMGESARRYIINNCSQEAIAQQFWEFISDVD